MKLLDTHYYDGKLPTDNDPIKELRELDQNKLKEEKQVFFNWLKEQIINRDNIFTKDALDAIRIIYIGIHSGSNKDSTDDMYGCDLLYLIIKKIKDMEQKDLDDVLIFLEEQLSDIVVSGSCAQGRVKRLYQVYLVFY